MPKTYDYMAPEEVENYREYHRLKNAKRTEEATPEMRAAVARYGFVRKSLKKGADPLREHTRKPLGRTVRERWEAFVSIPSSYECWTWQGFRDANGYGKLKVDGKMQLAHRVAYSLHVGAIPEGFEIDHLCGEGARGCVNPAHLHALSRADHAAKTGREQRVLTDRQEAEVWALYHMGWGTQAELAKQYGVSSVQYALERRNKVIAS